MYYIEMYIIMCGPRLIMLAVSFLIPLLVIDAADKLIDYLSESTSTSSLMP